MTRLHRRRSLRVLTAAAFAATALAFLLPFLRVSEEVTAHASGIELVTGDVQYSGSYVHGSYVGEVQTVVHRARGPAWFILVVALVGALLACVPRLVAEWATAAFGILLLLGFVAFWQASSLEFVPTERPIGFWLALAFAFAATGLAVGRLRSYYAQWRV